MSKRTLYTIVTPLPSTITRETAIAALHTHHEMIELNPLVIKHTQCRPPPQAPADEFHATWYELTDKISYFPGIKGKVSYKACFHNLPRGLQTHVYAPAGLEIKEKWTIGGNEPGEPREVLELGLVGVPRDGLYLREDVDMTCNFFLTGFVKKTLRRAHSVLVDRLVVKADLDDDQRVRKHYGAPTPEVDEGSDRAWTPSIRSASTFRNDSAQTSKTSHMLLDLPPIDTHRPLISEFRTWDARSPTVTTSSRSASTRSSAQTASERNRKKMHRMSLQGPMMFGGAHSPLRSPAYQDPMYNPYANMIKSPYAMPQASHSATELQVAELPADESAGPDYMRQQSIHEDAIREFLDKPGSAWPPRKDSSMYSERLNPLKSQPVGGRAKTYRFELEG
ncbi:hypothetical protein CAC42_4032 [Sphaceloma murrayae]|uniref:DUF7053 domain-containing protein n=1 Tax=Sphaceloma murrayae TaxID=2082308 RepID=A0A2K1QT71_9PEZI|nr:hypothetical protein CAC42_4032 [Sphaceloma murrayae]